MESGVDGPLGVVPVVLSGAGGLGASTMPVLDGVVDGVGTESVGTELVTGKVEAVGEELNSLPLTLLAGCGMLGGPEVGRWSGLEAFGFEKLELGKLWCGRGWSGRGSSSSCCSRSLMPSSKPGEFGLGGVAPPLRGVRTSSAGTLLADSRRSMLLPVPSSSVARMVEGSAGP